jgi:dienelactone hydrolase
MKRVLLLVQALCLLLGSAAAATAEDVTFPGDGLTLRGELFRPDGKGPFPAVVGMHGCGGLYTKGGELTARFADWAKRFTDAGYLVLMPDSFGPRGAKSQCRTQDRVARASRERPDDAIAAGEYLRTRTDVKPDAITLAGWSNGGTTVLYALRNAARRRADQPFAKAVAFYPGCRLPLKRGNWHSRIPLLLLIGEADDWTPAKPCLDLIEEAKDDGDPVAIVTYPGAYHEFDHPDMPVRELRGLAFGAKGGKAHAGTDPAARADSIRRVMDYLAR